MFPIPAPPKKDCFFSARHPWPRPPSYSTISRATQVRLLKVAGDRMSCFGCLSLQLVGGVQGLGGWHEGDGQHGVFGLAMSKFAAQFYIEFYPIGSRPG